MDTKKVIEQLVKIADKQQQIINKLAQIQTPPTDLHPAAPSHDVIAALHKAAPAAMKLVDPSGSRLAGDKVQLKFLPGATQQTVQTLQQTVDHLVRTNAVAGGPFTIVVVQ